MSITNDVFIHHPETSLRHALKPFLTQRAEALASCAYLSVTHKDISIQHTYKIEDFLTSCIDSLLFVVSCVFSTELLLTQAINKHLENWTVFRLSASLIRCRK